MPAKHSAKRKERGSLRAQRTVRDWIRKRWKQKLRRMQAERARIAGAGGNTKKLDRRIAYHKQRMENESPYSTATAYLTPLSTIRRIGRIQKIRKKREKKKS